MSHNGSPNQVAIVGVSLVVALLTGCGGGSGGSGANSTALLGGASSLGTGGNRPSGGTPSIGTGGSRASGGSLTGYRDTTVVVIGSGGTSGQGGAGVAGTMAPNVGGQGPGTSAVATVGGAGASGGASGYGGRSGTPPTGGSSAVGAGGTSTASATGGSSKGGSSAIGAGGATTNAALVIPDPSWACGMPDGIVDPTQGEIVFRATLTLGATHDVGTTPFGHRRVLDVKSGTVTGRVQGSFLAGGLELELTLSNGSVELEQIDVLRASDGTLIYLRSCGVAPAGNSVVRVVPDFEVATSSTLAWLNTGKFVGTRVIDAAANTLQLDIYDISKVTSTGTHIQITDPSGVPNQPWDCSTSTGAKGTSVFTETVTLGSSLSIGASKRGTRNIIPITGGTTTGRVIGSVLSGGGDYQLIGSSTKLDARYNLSTSDGEFIVVRNCGPMGALVPQFEARVGGPYAFLNANTYVSSDPGSASGGVSITFYDKK